jgi:hypothetical protein
MKKRAKDIEEPYVTAPKTDLDRQYLRMMYGEQAEHARLHEELRGSATGLFVALIAGLLAYAATEVSQAWAAGLLIVATSSIGALVNLKHYERYEMHLWRLRGFRKSLEKEISPDLTAINDLWTKYHNQKNPKLGRLRLRTLWNVIYGITGLIGVWLVLHGIPTSIINKMPMQ